MAARTVVPPLRTPAAARAATVCRQLDTTKDYGATVLVLSTTEDLNLVLPSTVVWSRSVHYCVCALFSTLKERPTPAPRSRHAPISLESVTVVVVEREITSPRLERFAEI